jgi:hypothetical protein
MHRLTHRRLNPNFARQRNHQGQLAALWLAVVGAWRGVRAQARQESIDDATLRDLGVARCELDSFHAESEGRAVRTRLRVVQRTPGER